MMKFAALAAPIAALAAIMTVQPAAAQGQFNEEEVSALARVAMPRAFQSLQQKCSPILPLNSYIFANGDELLYRLQGASAGAWPQARGAIIRLVTRENPQIAALLNAMPPESLQPFVDELIAGMVSTKLETGRCEQIDRILELLDPLPAENLAELIGIAVIEAQQDEAGIMATGLNR